MVMSNTTIDILGEHTCDIQICKKITSNYIQLLEEINNKNLICNLSIKPSHIGADINYKTAFENFREILEAANRYDNFTAQIGLFPQKEYYNVTMPDYVNLTYDFTPNYFFFLS